MKYILAGALLFGASAVQAADLPRELDWLAPGADPVTALTQAPAECLDRPDEPDAAYQVEVGRAAFRTPFLLGGQAARQGLTCQACHINGTDNPHFHIPNLSGAPGTVDVTSAVFSEVRGDGVFNPVPIPSLVEAAERPDFGHAGTASALSEFVRDVIVDEFAADRLTEPVFNAVVAYVAALRPDACPKKTMQPVTLATYIDDVERAAGALSDALERDDGQVGEFLVLAIQSRLGRLNERFAGAGVTDASRALADLSRQLGALRKTVGARPEAARDPLAVWRGQFEETARRLAAMEDQSLFNPAVARAVLNREAEE